MLRAPVVLEGKARLRGGASGRRRRGAMPRLKKSLKNRSKEKKKVLKRRRIRRKKSLRKGTRGK
jgi:hypothetical protein